MSVFRIYRIEHHNKLSTQTMVNCYYGHALVTKSGDRDYDTREKAIANIPKNGEDYTVLEVFSE